MQPANAQTAEKEALRVLWGSDSEGLENEKISSVSRLDSRYSSQEVDEEDLSLLDPQGEQWKDCDEELPNFSSLQAADPDSKRRAKKNREKLVGKTGF
jgi:hypothetical protein